MNADFSSRFEMALFQTKLILPKDRILVACSGGPDSTALFHLLYALRKKWKLKLGLLHFNHGLRGRESKRDEDFVRALGKKYKIRVIVGKKNVAAFAKEKKLSIEEAARELRYGFFVEAAKKTHTDSVALAHHQEDQAETILMRMLQGTGLRGLCGIRESFEKESVRFIRPLLSFSKKEILEFLKVNSFKYQKDTSNQSPRFLRNRIRLELLPWIQSTINPRAVEALSRIPAILREEEEAMGFFEEAAWKSVAKGKKIKLSRKAFQALPAALQFRILDRVLKMADAASGLSFEAWQKLKRDLHKIRHRVSFPRNVDLEFRKDRIVVFKK